MIKPNKLTDPNNCVVFNSYKILNFLKKKKKATYQVVLKNQVDELGESSNLHQSPLFGFLIQQSNRLRKLHHDFRKFRVIITNKMIHLPLSNHHA